MAEREDDGILAELLRLRSENERLMRVIGLATAEADHAWHCPVSGRARRHGGELATCACWLAQARATLGAMSEALVDP